MKKCPHPHKVQHASQFRAVGHAREMQAHGGSPDLQAYKCRCGFWHIGHSQASLRVRIRTALRA